MPVAARGRAPRGELPLTRCAEEAEDEADDGLKLAGARTSWRRRAAGVRGYAKRHACALAAFVAFVACVAAWYGVLARGVAARDVAHSVRAPVVARACVRQVPARLGV
jgi:hypothetical protein